MKNMGNDIVLFMDGNIQLEVPVSRDGESVWLSANQMAVLFDKDETNIRKHINNVFRSSEVDKNNNTQKMRVDGVKQSVAFYSLDVILAVGYRVNSQRGIAFRKWANNVLKQFILQGYAINEKRLQALKKTVDIQSRMLADALDIEEKDVLRRGIKRSQDAFLISKASRYDIKGGICMKRNYWALLVFALIIVLQWIGLGFYGQIRFIFLIIILVLIVLLAILLRK